MVSLSLKRIAQAVAARYSDVEKSIHSVSSDTRTLRAGSLFIAIKGDNFDGHDFVSQAFAKGASAAVVEKKTAGCTLCVKDTVRAYGKIANLHRKQWNGKIIALTGSVGKTTTKTMLYSILSRAANTYASEGNNNNEIGVAQSLLALGQQHRYAVIELGARKSGDIAWLTQISQPDIGMIINTAPAHLETFGSMKGIIRGKGELFHHLPAQSLSVLNGDDQSYTTLREYRKSYWYSLEKADAHCFLRDVRMDDCTSSFQLHLATNNTHENIRVLLPVSGKHNLYNAAACALTASLLDISMQHIRDGLQHFEPPSGRQKVIQIGDAVQLIDDSYNASPASVRASVDSLVLSTNSILVVVLGDMRELGDKSAHMHRQIGEYIAHRGVHMLFTYGDMASQSSHSFNEMRHGMGFAFSSLEILTDKLCATIACLNTPVRILVKGSRAMKMEQVIQKTMSRREICYSH